MESVQKQVIALSHKVDALYQVVEVLSQNVTEVLSVAHNSANHPEENNYSLSVSASKPYSMQNHSRLDSAMAHKDVLIDSNGRDKNSHQGSEKELAPEIQIQRLTAQLTAAYNRIAALEEQLLSRRVYS